MRVLVTGVTGFIGAHVAAALAERGAQVYGAALPGAPRKRLHTLAGDLEVLEGDLADLAWCRELVATVRPEAVVHLAWYAEPGAYLTAVPENLSSLRGGINLLETLTDEGTCGRVVVAGTCLENVATPRPSIYAAAKAAQHALAVGLAASGLAASGLAGSKPTASGATASSTASPAPFSATCAHVFYLYGPWEDPRRVVPTVIGSVLRREPIDVTSGTRPRDYLHVEDVASALCAVLASDLEGRVDVCTGRPVPLREVFEEIGRATGRRDLIRTGARPAERGDRTEWPSTGDATPLLGTGWRPRYSLPEGIQQTTAWWSTRKGVRE